jgi:hypothetical protein
MSSDKKVPTYYLVTSRVRAGAQQDNNTELRILRRPDEHSVKIDKDRVRRLSVIHAATRTTTAGATIQTTADTQRNMAEDDDPLRCQACDETYYNHSQNKHETN